MPPTQYLTHQDALVLLAGIGAGELGHKWMQRFERSFYSACESTAARDPVGQFLEATRRTYVSVSYDENVSAMSLGDVLRLRAEQFDNYVSRLNVARRLQEGKSLREIFPEAIEGLSERLAEHYPFDYD